MTIAEEARRAELERTKAELRSAEQQKRQRVRLVLIMAGVLIAAVAGATGWWQDRQATARRAEKEQEDVRLRAGVTLALDQADDLLRKDRPEEAEVALTQAADRLGDGGPPDLVDRLAETRRDLGLYRELDRIRDKYWGKGTQDASWGDYRKALGGYGVVGPGVTVERAAERVRSSRMAGRIIAALDDGLRSVRSGAASVEEPADVAFVTGLVGRVDPDPVAAVVRVANDTTLDRLRELARRLDGAALQPAIAYRLILHYGIPPEDAHRILRTAVAAHPSDFLVLYAAGSRLTAEVEDPARPDQRALLEEGIGYLRAAIAARPRYATIYNVLGGALNQKKDWVGAEAAARTALRLDPGLLDAHNTLCIALGGRRRYGEALRTVRVALAGDPRWVANPWNYARYNAACSAARCGTGQATDGPPPGEWPALRREALAWLTADLAALKASVARGTADGVRNWYEEHAHIEHWLADEDLALIRHPIAIGLLPPDEQGEWRSLWAEVRRFSDETAEREPAPPPRPSRGPVKP